jgi:hypothetical protein
LLLLLVALAAYCFVFPTQPQAPTKAWVPADTGTQDCGMDYHRHALDLDEHGKPVVNKQKGEPDIVFDGLCHDEHENVVKPRKVLPVPKK